MLIWRKCVWIQTLLYANPVLPSSIHHFQSFILLLSINVREILRFKRVYIIYYKHSCYTHWTHGLAVKPLSIGAHLGKIGLNTRFWNVPIPFKPSSRFSFPVLYTFIVNKMSTPSSNGAIYWKSGCRSNWQQRHWTSTSIDPALTLIPHSQHKDTHQIYSKPSRLVNQLQLKPTWCLLNSHTYWGVEGSHPERLSTEEKPAQITACHQ